MKNQIINIYRFIREYFIQLEQRRKRKLYSGDNKTIIARNCVAGVIYHDLGLEFKSPTINLWIENPEFCEFLKYLPDFIRGELQEITSPYDYPVGKLSCMTVDGKKQIKIYFQHYATFQDARQQWLKRCQRMDLNNIYIIVEDGNNLTQTDVDRYECLGFDKMAILSGNRNLKGKHIVYMKSFTRKSFPGTSVKHRGLFGKRWVDEFDYVSFLDS